DSRCNLRRIPPKQLKQAQNPQENELHLVRVALDPFLMRPDPRQNEVDLPQTELDALPFNLCLPRIALCLA
uniref:hypothetical protein n=1 Tax=Candidatus Electronema sp. TaxID=2698783 RepID=UPI0040576F85